ncbi:protein CDV3 homolog isoform X1 [Styela clava]
MEDGSTQMADLPPAEDDSLDDFFAKKDKGKKGKKKKTKYIATEALAKTLEKINAGVEEEESKAPKKEKETSDGMKGVNNNVDGEEWHEYEDESERDYSDLKIQNFQISEQQEIEPEPEPQYNDEGELIPPKEAEGPWKNVTKETSQSPAPEPAPMRKPEPTSEPAVTKSVYRPPHSRMTPSSGGTPSSGIQPGSGRRRRPQEAPVINSEIDFPSLASAVQDTEHHVGFETVKSGAKSISRSQQQQQNSSQSAGLTLGNQFAALRD